MTQLFQVHPRNPQPRLIGQAAALLRDGALLAYPTDSCYALGCALDARAAVDRIRRIREVGPDHHLTLVCRDLSELAQYARVDNARFRLLKALTPGPYTFILRASREVPRRFQHHRRATIGLRVPDNAVARALLERHDAPLMSSTLLLPGDDLPLTEPVDMSERLRGRVDLIIDGGHCGHRPTTVLDLTEDEPRVLRQGLGDTSLFER